MGTQNVLFFELIGRVGEELATATWRDGQLVASDELLRRSRLLVGMGETFAVEGRELRVLAGLGDAFAAALTIIRSLDAVLQARIDLDTDDNEAARLAIEFQGSTASAIDWTDLKS